MERVPAGGRLPWDKAPGPDTVLNEILKIFLKEDPEALLSPFNVYWRGATFLKRWKKARLVLVYKGEEDRRWRPEASGQSA